MSYIDKDFVQQEINNAVTSLANSIKNKFAKKADLDEKISIDNLVEGENIEIKKNEDGIVKISASGDLSTDYDKATNKPSINGVELSGNKTTEDLKIESGKIDEIKVNGTALEIKEKSVNIDLSGKVDVEDGKGLSTNDYDDDAVEEVAKIKDKLDINQGATNKGKALVVGEDGKVTYGEIPEGVVVEQTYSETSENAQSGKAVAEAIEDKVDKVDGKELSSNDYTDSEKEEVAKIKDKVDKEDGKSLVLNTDIAQITTNKEAIQKLNGDEKEDGSVKQIVASAIADTTHLKKDIIDHKPTVAEAKENILYLVPTDEEGIYEQYCLISGKIVGLDNTKVNLEGYFKTENIVKAFGETTSDDKVASEKLVSDKLAEKLDIQQKVADKGKALVVGEDGKVAPVKLESNLKCIVYEDDIYTDRKGEFIKALKSVLGADKEEACYIRLYSSGETFMDIPSSWYTGYAVLEGQTIYVQLQDADNIDIDVNYVAYINLTDTTFTFKEKKQANGATDKAIATNWVNGYNLIPFPYMRTELLPAVYPITTVGVTYTVMPDGSIHAIGTPTNTNGVFVANFKLPIGKYAISGSFDGEFGARVRLAIDDVFNNASSYMGSVGIFELTKESNINVQLQFLHAGTPVDDYFKPMIVRVNEDGSYPTEFQVNALGNVEITEKLRKTPSNSELVNNWNENGYNLMKFPYPFAQGQVRRGITYTYLEDGSIIANGTATADMDSYIDISYQTASLLLPIGKYKITDGANGTDQTHWVTAYNGNDAVSTPEIQRSSRNWGLFELTEPTKVFFQARVLRGRTVENLVFKPMLVKLNDDGTYPTEYQRYASGNVELTDRIARKEIELAELKMLGWNVPIEMTTGNFNVTNEILNNGKTFRQRIQRVKADELTWNPYTGHKFSASISGIKCYGYYPYVINNIYLDGYEYVLSGEFGFGDKNQITATGNNTYSLSGIEIYNPKYSYTSDLIKHLKDKYVYFELETPIESLVDGNEIITKMLGGTKVILPENTYFTNNDEVFEALSIEHNDYLPCIGVFTKSDGSRHIVNVLSRYSTALVVSTADKDSPDYVTLNSDTVLEVYVAFRRQ